MLLLAFAAVVVDNRPGASQAIGAEAAPSSPEELGERIRADLPYWTAVMRAAGIQPE